MKKAIITLAILLQGVLGFSQSKNVVTERKYFLQDGLDKFVGTWCYQQNDEYFKIVLKKKEFKNNGRVINFIEGYHIYKNKGILVDGLKNDKMNDTQTFTAGVVTASGTHYLLFIDDMEKFKSFANEITRPEVHELFENIYENAFKIKLGNSTETNEQGFLRFLSINKSGLALMKGNGSFDSWERKILSNNNTVITNPCK
jgi:hypothetical protein